MKLDADRLAGSGRSGQSDRRLRALIQSAGPEVRQQLQLDDDEQNLPSRRIDGVFEGAGTLEFVELLRHLGIEAPFILRQVRGIFLAYPAHQSGCQDDQESLDGPFNGAFTTQLLRAWNGGEYKLNYDAFLQEIPLAMPETQKPNHFVVGATNSAFDHQTPFAV